MGDSAGVPLPAESGEPCLDAAWTEALDATDLLRSALDALGLAVDFPRLRGDVNVYGRPMVTVGRIAPAAARRLAAILALALPIPAAAGPVSAAERSAEVAPPRTAGSAAARADLSASMIANMTRDMRTNLAAGAEPPATGADWPLAPPPSTAAAPDGEQGGLALGADVAQLDQVRGDPQRLPA